MENTDAAAVIQDMEDKDTQQTQETAELWSAETLHQMKQKRMMKRNEQQVEIPQSSQQLGITGDSWQQKSPRAGMQIIHLRLQCAKPCFSEEEKEYFMAAALEGRGEDA